MAHFSSPADVISQLQAKAYVADDKIGTALFLADKMQKPILVEGPAGVGKTELAKVLASCLDTELIRLQCYEGLDEAKALYEWEYGKQLLYSQILRDKIGETLRDVPTLTGAIEAIASTDSAFFSERFLLKRPLLRAIASEKRSVLLIDEVDRADPEFEAFLLEVLSDFQVSVPEIGTIKAREIPLVVLTSNNAREITDALKRRCIHLFVGYPTAEREHQIVRAQLPKAASTLTTAVVRIVQNLRKLDLKKQPSVAETLDWVRALTLLNVQTLDAKLVEDTLNLVLKYEGDIKLASAKIGDLLT